MKTESFLVRYSVKHPKKVTILMILIMLILGAFIYRINIDTDPENMLSRNEAVRIFHNVMKKEFSLYDMVVLGVVNEKDPDGVFNPDSLKNIYELTEFAKDLCWPDHNNPGKEIGVIDILLVPVGGFYTIDSTEASQVCDQLKPNIIIPMHFKTAKCAYPIAEADDFLKGKTNVKRMGASEAEFEHKKLPVISEIMLLQPAL